MYLVTGPNQFGYKKNTGTVDALYVLKETVNYYSSRGSNVFVCFLDSSKAFDRVVHQGLFIKLLKRQVPLVFVQLLAAWYGDLSCVVRWEGATSLSFRIQAGVRQGGILSPRLYCIYVDEMA